MKKCAVCFTFVFVYLIAVTVPKDVCESCVSLSKCSQLTRMSKQDQESWMLKYPCYNHHPDDYGTSPSTKVSQVDLICCPNQTWGVEPNQSLSRLTVNQFGSPQDIPSFSDDQDQYPYKYDNVKRNKNDNRAASNLPSAKQWNTDIRGSPSRNSQATNVEPSRWLPMSNNYWNQRPDRNAWDIGNNNFYHGNNNRRLFNNNRRNDYDTDRRVGRNNQSEGRNQQDDRSNNQGYDNQYYPNYPSNRRSDDTSGQPGQCDRLTRFPPDPQRGCCGREASDDDRIIGTPFKINDNNQLETKLTKTIDGGKATELTQFPWTALLVATFHNGNQQTAFNCGGSLISSRFVLTAGHCVYDAEAVLRSVQVFLAEFDKRTFPRDCKVTPEGRKCIDNIAINSEDVILHPRFDETRLQNDIALIKLQSDAPYTEYIRPICLPSINIDNPEHNRLPLTVAGWGRNGQYKTDIKQSTTVHLVPQHDCRKFYPDLTPRHLCAAGYSGEDTCKGDSGGPLMVLYRGVYYAVGVVSGKRTDAPCGSAVPSLYTNVYHYLDWIRSNIGN